MPDTSSDTSHSMNTIEIRVMSENNNATLSGPMPSSTLFQTTCDTAGQIVQEFGLSQHAPSLQDAPQRPSISLWGQKTREPSFSDLPLDDNSGNSVVNPMMVSNTPSISPLDPLNRQENHRELPQPRERLQSQGEKSGPVRSNSSSSAAILLLPQPYEPATVQTAHQRSGTEVNSIPMYDPSTQAFRAETNTPFQNTLDNDFWHGFQSRDFHFGYEMMGYLDLSLPVTVLPIPAQEEQDTTTPPVLFSAAQLLELQDLWPTQRPTSGIPLIRTLWTHVAHHDAANIFSTPSVSNFESCKEQQYSRWHMNEECRDRLAQFGERLNDVLSRKDVEEASAIGFSPGSGCAQMSSSSKCRGPDEMPSLEILDLSLEFFFRDFHQSLSFIHKATFDARTTPSPLLFSMCLVGLSLLDPHDSKLFIHHHLKVYSTLQDCSTNLPC